MAVAQRVGVRVGAPRARCPDARCRGARCPGAGCPGARESAPSGSAPSRSSARRPGQPGEGRGELSVRCGSCDVRGVRRRVHVPQRRQIAHASAPRRRAGAAGRRRSPGSDIGTPRSRSGSGAARPSAQKPPSSAGPNQASHPSQASGDERGRQIGGGDLRGVHADEQRRSGAAAERRREPLVEAAGALRDDFDAGRQPGTGPSVEHEDAPPGRRREPPCAGCH